MRKHIVEHNISIFYSLFHEIKKEKSSSLFLVLIVDLLLLINNDFANS